MKKISFVIVELILLLILLKLVILPSENGWTTIAYAPFVITALLISTFALAKEFKVLKKSSSKEGIQINNPMVLLLILIAFIFLLAGVARVFFPDVFDSLAKGWGF